MCRFLLQKQMGSRNQKRERKTSRRIEKDLGPEAERNGGYPLKENRETGWAPPRPLPVSERQPNTSHANVIKTR